MQPNKGIVLRPGRIVLCDTYRQVNLYHTIITALMKREPPATPISTNVLDYPCTMSGFKRESPAAEVSSKSKAVLTLSVSDLWRFSWSALLAQQWTAL
jgi:hypothetical protein